MGGRGMRGGMRKWLRMADNQCERIRRVVLREDERENRIGWGTVYYRRNEEGVRYAVY
jgi:hypothetical protein